MIFIIKKWRFSTLSNAMSINFSRRKTKIFSIFNILSKILINSFSKAHYETVVKQNGYWQSESIKCKKISEKSDQNCRKNLIY